MKIISKIRTFVDIQRTLSEKKQKFWSNTVFGSPFNSEVNQNVLDMLIVLCGGGDICKGHKILEANKSKPFNFFLAAFFLNESLYTQ